MKKIMACAFAGVLMILFSNIGVSYAGHGNGAPAGRSDTRAERACAREKGCFAQTYGEKERHHKRKKDGADEAGEKGSDTGSTGKTGEARARHAGCNQGHAGDSGCPF